jgi:hypothetical protein
MAATKWKNRYPKCITDYSFESKMTHTKDEVLKQALEALEPLTLNAELRGDNLPEKNEIHKMADAGFKAILAIKQALAAPVQEPVAINEVQKLSDGFIENPEAIKYLLDCLRWAQGEEGLPQTHYNFMCAFQRKGYAVLQRLNEDYGPEWTFSKHATTPPAPEKKPAMILTVTPFTRPYVWSIRSNWNTPDGLYFDPTSGELFSVSNNPYVQYLGRLPSEYVKTNQSQMELL